MFRFEPYILAVESRDMQAAQRIIRIARLAGFRELGDTTAGHFPQRVMVGIRCSIKIHSFIHYTLSNPQISFVAANILRQPSSLPCLVMFSTM